MPLFATVSVAKEDYIGVSEGDAYTWNISYVKDVYDVYYEDFMKFIYGDEDINLDDATEITKGYYENRSINSDTTLYYKIQANKNKNMTIMANMSYAADLHVNLYDIDSSQIGQYSSHSVYSKYTERMIVVDTPYAGYYIIKFANEGSSDLLYDLTINITDWSGEDMYEDNDAYDDYSRINAGDYFGYLECSYGDEDWYKLSIYDYETIEVSISFTHSEGDLNLYVYHSVDNVLTLVDSSTGTSDTESCSDIVGDDDNSGFYIVVNNTTPASTNHTYSMIVSEEGEPNGGDTSLLDLEGIRFKITDIHKEAEVEGEGEDDKVNGVEVAYDVFYTESIANEDDWEEQDEETLTIIDPAEDDYFYYVFEFIIAKGVDWKEAVKDCKDYYEDIDYVEVEVKEEWSGLRIAYDYNDNDLKIVEQVCRYQSNGVMEYMQFLYDGEILATYELQVLVPEYILVIGGIVAAVIGGIAIAVYFIVRHRR